MKYDDYKIPYFLENWKIEHICEYLTRNFLLFFNWTASYHFSCVLKYNIIYRSCGYWIIILSLLKQVFVGFGQWAESWHNYYLSLLEPAVMYKAA